MREHGTKTTPIFLPADGEACWSLLPSSVSLLPCSTVQPENTYSCIVKVTCQVWESQKRIRINTNHSYHQRSSPWAGLNWSNNKARCSFNQSNRKRWGAKLVNENVYPIRHFIVTPSLEEWSTKAKEAPSPHKVRLVRLDTNPVFQSFSYS